MFANTQAAGIAVGSPDVCLTPPGPVPVAYTNVAPQPLGTPAVDNVLFVCAPAHNLSTVVPETQGDDPGVALGVASGTVMGSSRHVSGCSTVLLGGAPATRLTSPTIANTTNVSGATVTPSQTKVLLLAP